MHKNLYQPKYRAPNMIYLVSLLYVSGCYSVDYDNATRTEIVFEALSYEVWVYLAYIILPIVYLTVLCYIRCHKVQ